MIRISQVRQPLIRETTSAFSYEDNGEIKTDNVRIRYRSRTVQALKEQKKMIADKGEDAYISDTLFADIAELPDFVDEKGKPLELTLEFFEQTDLENLKAMRTAIDSDLNPKSTPGSLPDN